MSLGSSGRKGGENFALVACVEGCPIYQEPSGQLLVAVAQRPQE